MEPDHRPQFPAGGAEAGSPWGGEFVSIAERLLISPRWGRFHPEALEEGVRLLEGAVIGRVAENGQQAVLVSLVPALFIGWLAWEGERVSPGRPVARLLALQT